MGICKAITSAMFLLRTANTKGYESSVVSPIAMYAAILRLQMSAKGPLKNTPRISATRLSIRIIAMVASGIPAKRMNEMKYVPVTNPSMCINATINATRMTEPRCFFRTVKLGKAASCCCCLSRS